MAEREEEKTIGEENREKGNGKEGKRQGKKLSGKAKFWIAILLLFIISLPGYLLGLTVRTYEIKDERIQGKLRIALVTDLHSCKYGITRLSGESTLLETGSGTVRLCGIDDPDIVLVQSQLNANAELLDLKGSISDKEFTILLTHRPELIDKYEQAGFDLVLAGHAHGGQVRIPGIMNGFYAPNQGLLPKYAGGRYEKNGMTMIVSRGLAKESTKFPRFCNPPELVIIDLAGTK